MVRTSRWHRRSAKRLALSRLALGISLFTASSAASGQEARPYRITGGAIEVLLPSGGCTSASDFEIAQKTPMIIVLRRVRADECKKNLPRGEWISFSSERLGVPVKDGQDLTILETK